jgi:serine/threonine protein kinase
MGFLQHRVGDCIKERYEVLEHLGGGNFGSVYRVRDTVVGNILACKEMHVLDDPSTPHDERAAALDLFKREALNLATLRHPNIPAAYFEQEDGAWRICPRCGFDFPAAPKCPDHGAELLPVSQRHYLMMDFVDGPTLEELASQTGRPLEEKAALEWIGQIAGALRSLHRVGIVHRDIKPDNIKIRSSDNVATLLDFGLTKKVEETGSYGTAPLSGTTRFGTVGYAPENLQERENPEHRSDIYALGMTLYRLLSGRDPQEPAQLIEMRKFSPRYFNKNISPETERLIAVATAPELSWRYQTIDDFIAELKAIHKPEEAGFSAPPFTFADGSRARNAGELARLVERKPDESLKYLTSGMFATWLQQNGLAAGAQAASEAVKHHADNPPRALEIFRRSLYPSGASGVRPHLQISPGALHFGELPSGASAAISVVIRNVGPGLAWGTLEIEGVPALQTNPRDHDPPQQLSTPLPGLEIIKEFQGNDVRFEANLDSSRVPAGEYSGSILIKTDFEQGRIPVSYTIAPLQLTVEPQALEFGVVPVGEKFTRELRFRLPQKYATPTSGKPRGTTYISRNLQGLFAPERFEGDTVSVTVDASTPGAVARAYEGAIQLDTNGGRFRVPVSYRIALAPEKMLSLVLGSTLAGGVGAGVLRLLYVFVNPDYASNWLVHESAASVPSLTEYSFSSGAILIGALLALALSQLVATRIEKSSKRKKPDPTLRPVLGCLFLVLSAPIGIAATFVLHYVLWGFGDWLLYPLQTGVLAALPAQNPAPSWAALGTLGGLVWGASRALTSIGILWARYATPILMSLVFFILMLNAMLSTGR